MPLFAEGTAVTCIPKSIEDLLVDHPNFKIIAETLCRLPVKTIDPHGLVYVHQREYAIVAPNDDMIEILGSEDATTCQFCVIRHSGSGITGLGHFDRVEVDETIQLMIEEIHNQSVEYPDGRLEAHIIGGFIDNRGESWKLTQDLFGALMKQSREIHLLSACVVDLNDVVRDEIHYPIIYGIAVWVRTGDIVKAVFEDKGPEEDVRSAAVFVGWQKAMKVYDSHSKVFQIGPFTWEPNAEAGEWADMPSDVIRKHLSTSPDQEPAHFVSHVRSALRIIQENPRPHETLFPGGKPRRYIKRMDGSWKKLD